MPCVSRGRNAARALHGGSIPPLRLSKQIPDKFGFSVEEIAFGQLRFHRVVADVSRAVGEVIPIADHPVEVAFLPNRSGASDPQVDLPGGEAFP